MTLSRKTNKQKNNYHDDDKSLNEEEDKSLNEEQVSGEYFLKQRLHSEKWNSILFRGDREMSLPIKIILIKKTYGKEYLINGSKQFRQLCGKY